MRGFFTALFFVVLGIVGYRYVVQPYFLAGDGPSLVHGDQRSDATRPESGEAAAEPAAIVPAEVGEEERLARQIERNPGPGSDDERLRLGEIKLNKDGADDATEGEHLLRALFEHDTAHGPEAALLLVRWGVSDDAQLAGAHYLMERGAGTDGYFESLVLLGRQKLRHREDSERVQAWQLLSDAYFGRDDPEWRGSIRSELDQLVDELVFSPRLTRAFTQYTVESGDTLARIARQHGTTVESLRAINQLEGDRIHPGNRLKIISGTITLEVIKHDFRLDGRIDGRYLFSAQVGIGRFGKTPEGVFVIDVKQEKPSWQKDGFPAVPYGHPDNPLGEYWLGFKDTPEHYGYGIHGTSDPATIGTEASEGCIRMHNEDLKKLYKMVPLGAQVTIRE